MPPPRLFAAPAQPRRIKRGRAAADDSNDNNHRSRARSRLVNTLPPLPPLEGLTEDDLETPGDALAALMLLRQCWREDTAGVWPPPSSSASSSSSSSSFPSFQLPLCPPLLLRTQVHSLVDGRAAADREIDALRRRGVVRALRLPSSPTDVALVFESDYRASLEELGRGGEKKEGETTNNINDDDNDNVAVAVAARALSDALLALPCSSSAAIPSSELEEVLLHAAHGAEQVARRFSPSRKSSSHDDDEEKGTAANGWQRRQRAVDAIVAPLLRAGALSREHRCLGGGGVSTAAAIAAEQAATAFVLSAPGAGPFLAALGSGRVGLERALRRKRYKEAPEASVVKLVDEAARGVDGGGGGGKTGLRGAAAVAASFLADDEQEGNRSGAASASARARRAALLHRPALSGRFLVRDALGSGRLVRIRTTAGDMLRLAVERVG